VNLFLIKVFFLGLDSVAFIDRPMVLRGYKSITTAR